MLGKLNRVSTLHFTSKRTLDETKYNLKIISMGNFCLYMSKPKNNRKVNEYYCKKSLQGKTRKWQKIKFKIMMNIINTRLFK